VSALTHEKECMSSIEKKRSVIGDADGELDGLREIHPHVGLIDRRRS
jgi:hypothetical protein